MANFLPTKTAYPHPRKKNVKNIKIVGFCVIFNSSKNKRKELKKWTFQHIRPPSFPQKGQELENIDHFVKKILRPAKICLSFHVFYPPPPQKKTVFIPRPWQKKI